MGDIYKTYFESMPCFLTIQDRNLNIIQANLKFRNNFGPHEGRHCYQVYKRRPEKCEVCPVELSFRDGEAHKSEELVKTLDGREVWVIVYATPIRNESGEITGVMEMSTDITEIKLLQMQLKESQERYRLLFEEVPCYISIQNRELKIVDANRMHRDAFGTSYGLKCFEAYKHRKEECIPCIVRHTFQDGKVHTSEEVVTSCTNQNMNVLVHAAPLRNALGEIEKVIEMSTDITQIRQLQDKLSSIGLLISSISHDIKGLLNALDGGIYLINTGIKNNDKSRLDRGWEITQRNLSRIRSMVLDILYYAKDREPDWQSISVQSLAKEVCSFLEEKSRSLQIELKQTMEASSEMLEADPSALKSLLINLLDNSLDACRVDKQKEKHWVSLVVKDNPTHILFEVSDNGIGMERETREKAFSLFFSSKGASGTGLGLFIANKIAQSHGGKINLESQEGIGTKFTVEMLKKRPEKTL